MEEASSSVAWAQELEKEDHNPESLEQGISSTAFIAKDMPFHPECLEAALAVLYNTHNLKAITTSSDDDDDSNKNKNKNNFKGSVQTKGQLWLANSNAFFLYTFKRQIRNQLKRDLVMHPPFVERMALGGDGNDGGFHQGRTSGIL